MGLRGRSNLIGEYFFFITTTVVRFLPIFRNDIFCDILIENIKHYQLRYQFVVLGYVIMLFHFHWIIQVNPSLGTVSDIMRYIKKFTAWQIFDKIKQSSNSTLEQIFKE
jgi:REP element-mobilizing transposase RayT